jgi:hypothetical protein
MKLYPPTRRKDTICRVPEKGLHTEREETVMSHLPADDIVAKHGKTYKELPCDD